MKKGFYVLMLIGSVLNLMFTVSCNSTPTFEELKSDEKKKVKKILNANNINVLSEYPADGVFGENDYVQLSSGIYLNVVDSGNGNRAVYGTTDVLIRASGRFYYQSDTGTWFSTFGNSSYPLEFKYGYAVNVVNSNASSGNNLYYYYFGMGMESVLSYVGDSAVVKLIVPGYSEVASGYAGGSTFQTADRYEFIPIHFDRLRYIFYE